MAGVFFLQRSVIQCWWHCFRCVLFCLLTSPLSPQSVG